MPLRSCACSLRQRLLRQPCLIQAAPCSHAGNVLLKTHKVDRRGYIAKVSDFGLSRPLDMGQTHARCATRQGGTPLDACWGLFDLVFARFFLCPEHGASCSVHA